MRGFFVAGGNGAGVTALAALMRINADCRQAGMLAP